jgi:hypothetical protein
LKSIGFGLGVCERYIAWLLGSYGYGKCGWICCLVVYLPRSKNQELEVRQEDGGISVRITTMKKKLMA